MSTIRIRLRAPEGGSTITLAGDATVRVLLSEIAKAVSLSSFDIKYGYPPKPLQLDDSREDLPLSKLGIPLNGEQLTISPKGDVSQTSDDQKDVVQLDGSGIEPLSSTDVSGSSGKATSGPVSLTRKAMEIDVPEIPLADRGATLVLRVMPDDNSCFFRAFGTAVLPIDDRTMPELRAVVANTIQAEPETYTKVVLEQEPDDYCRWIQTSDAWGGAIEMGILSKYFDIEICSIDVQSLRIDKFNEDRPTRCILVYSGIHYDLIVQSPSEPPHLKADSPPEFDKRVWDLDDEDVLMKALELCRKLQAKHYYTDTGGMAIRCNLCGTVVYGEAQAAGHAGQTGHYDMAEVTT